MALLRLHELSSFSFLLALNECFHFGQLVFYFRQGDELYWVWRLPILKHPHLLLVKVLVNSMLSTHPSYVALGHLLIHHVFLFHECGLNPMHKLLKGINHVVKYTTYHTGNCWNSLEAGGFGLSDTALVVRGIGGPQVVVDFILLFLQGLRLSI